MATSTQGRSTPPSLKQHPHKHVFDRPGLISPSSPLEIVSKLGDSLIDKRARLMFHLTEYINLSRLDTVTAFARFSDPNLESRTPIHEYPSTSNPTVLFLIKTQVELCFCLMIDKRSQGASMEGAEGS